jgi:hypothetical protein
MRAQLGDHRNPVTHSSASSVTLARALARLRQREARQKLDEAMLRRCVHSSAMIGTLTHLDTLISVTRHTRKSAMLWLGCHSAKLAKLDEAMRAQLAMIGTLTHSSPRHISVKRHTRKRGRCWLTVATTRQARQELDEAMFVHSSPSSTRRCVHSSAMIRALTHSSPLNATLASRLARALARLRQCQVQRGSRSDVCKARRSLGDHRDPVTQAQLRQRQARQARQELDEAMLRRCVHSSR